MHLRCWFELGAAALLAVVCLGFYLDNKGQRRTIQLLERQGRRHARALDHLAHAVHRLLPSGPSWRSAPPAIHPAEPPPPKLPRPRKLRRR